MSSEQKFDQFEWLDEIRNSGVARPTVNKLVELFESGCGEAGYLLGLLHCPDLGDILSKECRRDISLSEEIALDWQTKAFPVILENANRGSASAMCLVALYYQAGYPPVTRDIDARIEWLEKAFSSGDETAGRELIAIYESESRINPQKVNKINSRLRQMRNK